MWILVADTGFIAEQNRPLAADLAADYDALANRLARRGIAIEAVTAAVAAFGVAIPSWGVGTGGTRFARFPGTGEPRDVFDKLADCGVVQALTRATPTVSLHFPWDEVSDMAAVREAGSRAGLGFDAVNSNTFQDSPGQALSYKFGSLSHTDAAVRAQAVAHNIHCAETGCGVGLDRTHRLDRRRCELPRPAAHAPRIRPLHRQHGAMSWPRYRTGCACSSNTRCTSLRSTRPSFRTGAARCWRHRRWATARRASSTSATTRPNVNIEMVVARLIAAGKLAGFHFNDSRYGDDDLDAGSVDPHRLFLVFNELVDAADLIAPAYMLDQSHNVTDPIESLMSSAMEVQRAYAQALLVDREKRWPGFQDANDALMASHTLRAAYATDVVPILAVARSRQGGAIDPVAAYRASGYRSQVAAVRPARAAGGGGIV